MKDVGIYGGGHSGTLWFRLRWPAEYLDIEFRDIKRLFLERPDVAIVHNPVNVHLHARLKELKEYGTKIAIGIDDDFSVLPHNFPAWSEMHPDSSARDLNWNTVGEVARMADRVIVTTTRLAVRYGTGRDTRTIPNCLPDFYYDIAATERKQWGVGWSGNLHQHRGDPEETNGALKDFPLRIVGLPKEELKEEYLTAFQTDNIMEWKGFLDLHGDYQKALSEFKVGVLPLKDTAFNRAKSNLTAITYAALGVPYVASPMPQYNRLASGLSARKPKNWKFTVESLLENDHLWNQQREKGFAEAEKYSLRKTIDEWKRAWCEW